jgi:hypothetical protein
MPVEARFSAPVQTGPGAHPASCTMGAGPFPGVRAAEAWLVSGIIRVSSGKSVSFAHLWDRKLSPSVFAVEE